VIVTITLPIPPSVNQIWRCQGSKVTKSKTYRNWQASCTMYALTNAIPRPRIRKAVAVEIIVRTGHGWRNTRDIDNIAKPVLDWLVLWGLLSTDNCSVVRSVLITIDTLPRPVACVDVTVSTLD